MIAIAVGLVWCVLQVTVVLLVLAGAYAAMGRSTARARSAVLHVGLGTIVLLTFLAFSPWPNWWPVEPALTAGAEDPLAASTSSDVSSATDEAGTDADEPASVGTGTEPAGLDSTWMAFATTFVESMRSPRIDAASREGNGPNWPWVMVGVFGVAAGLGVARLLLGWWGLVLLGRRSRKVDDAALVRLADEVRSEAGCRTQITLRESEVVSPAATFGWWRPVVLLSRDWRAWSDSELRAILGHEIGHVRRRDFLASLWMQFAVLLHFYHPLMHWLSNRLRLEQELVADAAAAESVGGSQPYLRILAEMSLRESSRRANWCVATFLPTRRTFLRRIEVLRDETPTRRGGWLAWAVALVAVAATGIGMAGLRGSLQAGAQGEDRDPPTKNPAATESAKAATAPLDLAWIPPDTMFLLSVDVARTKRNPVFEPILEAMKKDEGLRELTSGPFEDVGRFTMALLPGTEPRGNRPPEPHPVFLVHTGKDVTIDMLRETWPLGEEPAGSVGNVPYYEIRGGVGQGFYVALANPRLIVRVERKPFVEYVLRLGEKGAKESVWAPEVVPFAGEQLVEFVNLAALRKSLGPEFDPRRQPALSGMAMFVPLWEGVDTAVIAGSIDEGVSLEASLLCQSKEGAEQVSETLGALRVLGRNFVRQARLADLPQAPAEVRPTLDTVLQTADEILASAKFEADDSHVKGSASVEKLPTKEIVSSMLRATAAAREAARRTQSTNNLKQIGLAMHVYHERHGHFPPAVVKKPGQPPYSWRVELLPLLNGEKLYEQYKFDEPWDSEANKKVLAQMPAIYRDPNSKSATDACYFVLVGKGTVFDGDEGIRLADIRDGTSNTLMVVEAKREIPWTKPEDIPVDLTAKELPKLGGFHRGIFQAVLGDGAVRAVSHEIDPDVLRILIGRNDGKPLPNF